MKWNGKIVGGLLGFVALGGPWGALLGIAIGHQFDVGTDSRRAQHQAADIQQLFYSATFRIMGHVAKADGRVSEQEIAAARALMRSLRLSDAQVQAAIALYGEGKQPGFDLEGTVGELRRALAPFPHLAQFFLELQLQVGIAGNGLAGRPRERLALTARLLGVGGADFDRLEALMRGRMDGGRGARGADGTIDLARDYATLEVPARASDEEVVRAYRRQMSRHHPDKLQANGLPESMLERAKERTQQIQAAYERLRAARGMT